jgi:hypothetical protein
MLTIPYRINKDLVIGKNFISKGRTTIDTWNCLSNDLKVKLFVAAVCNEVFLIKIKYIKSLNDNYYYFIPIGPNRIGRVSCNRYKNEWSSNK